MTQATLQQLIEDNESTLNGCFILVYQDNDFLARQYANEIARKNKYDKVYCDSVRDVVVDVADVFFDDDVNDNSEYIVFEESFDSTDIRLLEKNIVVITKKIAKESEEVFKQSIVNLPKLDEWDIKDYISSVTNAQEKDVEMMYDLCGGDIFRIDNELTKIKSFDENYRSILLDKMICDKSFGDISKFSIFNLVNAIVTKNVKEVANIMTEIENIDVNVFALITLLFNNFKNVIAIQLSRNPTPESTGIKQNQFYAMKKNNIGFYNKNSLYSILAFLTSIDKLIKSGNLPIDISIDYIVYSILSM